MKYVMALLSLIFCIYTSIQSYQIAHAGAMYHIAQLEGDGGGGFVVTILLCISGAIALFKPVLSGLLFIFTGLVCIFVGVFYGDGTVSLWSLAPFSLAIVEFVLHRLKKRRKVTFETKHMAH